MTKLLRLLVITTILLASGVVAAANPNVDHLAGHGPNSGEFSAWTKLLANGKQIKFYAKYMQPGQKVQFMVQNESGVYEQLAWNRVDADDLNPDGSYANMQNHIYFIRTYDLIPGKNRVRILVDGEIAWGTKTYSLSEADALAPAWVQSASPADVEECKVIDGQSAAARAAFEGTLVDGKRARGNIGFPLSPTTLPINGESNFIVAMVGFDDAPPGDFSPASLLETQLKRMEEWGDYWSQGELDFNFQLVDEWIKLPVNHSDFPVKKELPFEERQGNANQVIKMIAAALPSNLDYDNLDGVLVYWSPEIEHFTSDLGLQGNEGLGLPFPVGSKEVFFWSGNRWHYQDSGVMTAEIKAAQTWSFWLYLILDSMGLHNHGPGNGWVNGLQQSENQKAGEFSGALLGWDEFKLGWTKDSQVHCLQPSEIGSVNEFLLTPREIPGGERRLAVVPFEDHGALVIESRRPIGWSETWTDEKSGLLVYFVDTELDIERVDSFTQAGCGNDPEQPKWAYHLFKDGFSGDCREFSNAFIRQGERLTYRSVQIELVHSASSKDYVRVIKID